MFEEPARHSQRCNSPAMYTCHIATGATAAAAILHYCMPLSMRLRLPWRSVLSSLLNVLLLHSSLKPLALKMLTDVQLGQAAFLEAALRRLVPKHVWSRVMHDPPLADLVELQPGSINRVSKRDIVENKHVVRALLETFPDKVPGSKVLEKAFFLLDKYYSGELLREPDKHVQAMTLACRCKLLVGAIRRLFRRSRHSRCVQS